MRRVVLLCVVLGTANLSIAQLTLPSFSMDDNPNNPFVSNFGAGLGAEDPFGLGTFGTSGFGSPSLVPAVGIMMDADLAKPNPAGSIQVDVALSPATGGPLTYLNAVSANTFINGSAGALHFMFSVDRISNGLSGSITMQSGLNQQPGDIYNSAASFTYPTNFVNMPVTAGFNGDLPTVAPAVGGNALLADESLLGLTVTSTPGTTTPLGTFVPTLNATSHDNIDALELREFDQNGDMVSDQTMYFSLGPDDINASLPGFIFNLPAGAAPVPGNVGVFAAASQIGLDPVLDDIDGLVVWNSQDATPNVANGGEDFALFSLSHGSAVLAANPTLSEADIFFTDFRGGFFRFAQANQLGLAASDNIDGFDIASLVTRTLTESLMRWMPEFSLPTCSRQHRRREVGC